MRFSVDFSLLAVVFSLIIFFAIIEVCSCVLLVHDLSLMPGAPADRHLRMAYRDVQLTPQLSQRERARPHAVHSLHFVLDRALLPLLPRALPALRVDGLRADQCAEPWCLVRAASTLDVGQRC